MVVNLASFFALYRTLTSLDRSLCSRVWERLARGKREWTTQRGRRKYREDREVQETERVKRGQGHSCDKEVIMKDVASA